MGVAGPADGARSSGRLQRARPPLAGTQPGEHGRVVRVIDGDALVLDTGQSVRLVGIEAPAGP